MNALSAPLFAETIKLPSGASLDFSGPALVMAIVNCNGDSFYPPSRVAANEAADRALEAEQAGAAIVDFGGESTRPGALYIDAEEELARVIPAVAGFRKHSRLPVSVDTRKAVVARAALDAGADIINDISALGDDKDMARLCAERGAPVALMHMKENPLTMQDAPFYKDALTEVKAWLVAAADRAVMAGIPREHIILDPGFGFGKSTADNIALLARLEEIRMTGYPLLIGLSRKTFIGEITRREVNERLAGTIAANAAAIMAGANIIRLHDVKEGVDLVKVLFEITKTKRSCFEPSGFETGALDIKEKLAF